MQRLSDRGRGRGHDVRRRRAHDGALGGRRRRKARRHPPDRARARPHRPSRHGARASTCRCSATPTRWWTPKAAAAFATGRRTSPGCRAATADPPGPAPARPGTEARSRSPARSKEGDQIAGFQRDRTAGSCARADRAVAGVRPARARSATASTRLTCGAGAARLSCRATIYNFDTEQARASLRKLAELEPAAAWPGHARPGHRRRARPAAERRQADAVMSRGRRSGAGRRSSPRPAATTRDAQGNVLTPARLADRRREARVRADARRAGSRPAATHEDVVAARVGVAVRAPRGALGDRGRRDRAPARAARAVARRRRQERAWVRGGAARALRRAFPRREAP